MTEQELRRLLAAVESGSLSRRSFARRMIGLGLTAPLVAEMLSYAGVAEAATLGDYKPTKRGGGGTLKTLFWQGATLLNPPFAVGTRKARAFSTSPSPPGTRTATLRRSSPPKSRP
jgi:peptide/nickel transport system substrate-binding protein